MQYFIDTSNPQQQFLQIKAVFQVKGTETQLQFPTWRPGRYELGNFVKNVRAFRVLNAKGEILPFKKTSKDQWLVQNGESKELHIYYSYYAAELNAGSTYFNKEMVYVNPVNCLLYIRDRENEKCSLKINLHQALTYSGTLPLNKNLEIAAESYHELVDSPFVFSNDVCSNEFQFKNTSFKISFIGLPEVPWEKVLNDFRKFTERQVLDFGSFPTKTYHYIIFATAHSSYHGVEHQASTIITLGPKPEIFENLYDELLGVSSHELYHAWNVKSIRSTDIWPYDYSKENYSTMGYLCEGITTYMGDHYLMDSGIWSYERYLKEFKNTLQKHSDNPGRFNYSLAESSFDTWIDGYVPGAPGRKTSIYTEGAIFAFYTDIFIRNHTNGRKSIKNVMKQLYQKYYQNNKGVRDEDFIAAVEDISSQKFQAIFQEFIFSRKSYESYLSETFEILGFNTINKPNTDFIASSFGMKVMERNNQYLIHAIFPGSRADVSGLMLGDKIIGVNKHLVEKNLPAWIKQFDSHKLELNIIRNNMLLDLPMNHLDGSWYNFMDIELMTLPANQAKRVFASWTRQRFHDVHKK
jgi:predicted metalloprotease with PDZ domain